MFDFRLKKVISVILSSCTLGCLSAFFAVNGAGNTVEVAANDGQLVTITTDDESKVIQEDEGDIVVNAGGDASKYSLLGNTIYYGECKNLIKSESVLPGNNDDFQLLVRAVKIQDGQGNDIVYDSNVSNPEMDTGWILNKGLATLNFLRSSTGSWKTFCYRYFPKTKEGDLGLTKIVLDESRSIPGREVYNLYTNDGKPIMPDLPIEEITTTSADGWNGVNSKTPLPGNSPQQFPQFPPFSPFPPFPPFPTQNAAPLTPYYNVQYTPGS